MPQSAKPGNELEFPAIQTYDSGEVVRWIGSSESDEPAARVLVTAPADEVDTELTSASVPVEAAGSGSDDGGAPTWLVVVALMLDAGGLAVGTASWLRRP